MLHKCSYERFLTVGKSSAADFTGHDRIRTAGFNGYHADLNKSGMKGGRHH